MTAGADGNYSINPWMRPEVRVGDDLDPSPGLDPAEIMYEVAALTPIPPPAPLQPRFLGFENAPPTIEDVLTMGPRVLMQDTPTKQESGQPGTLTPSGAPL